MDGIGAIGGIFETSKSSSVDGASTQQNLIEDRKKWEFANLGNMLNGSVNPNVLSAGAYMQ